MVIRAGLCLRKKESSANLQRSIRNTAMPTSRHIFAYSVSFRWWDACDGAVDRAPGLSGPKRFVEPGWAEKVGSVITAFILCPEPPVPPAAVIADKFNVLQMGMIASERVFKVLDNETAPSTKATKSRWHGKGGFIRFGRTTAKTVCFERCLLYAGSQANPIAIVGHTGSVLSSSVAEQAVPGSARPESGSAIPILKHTTWMRSAFESLWCCRMCSCSAERWPTM